MKKFKILGMLLVLGVLSLGLISCSNKADQEKMEKESSKEMTEADNMEKECATCKGDGTCKEDCECKAGEMDKEKSECKGDGTCKEDCECKAGEMDKEKSECKGDGTCKEDCECKAGEMDKEKSECKGDGTCKENCECKTGEMNKEDGMSNKDNMGKKDKMGKEETAIMNKGEMAPDFELVDMSGKTHKLSDYKGKKVYLKFWASWCPICVTSLPETNELAGMDNDFVVLSMAAPGFKNEKSEEDLKKWYMSLGYDNLPVLLDNEGKTIQEYGIRAYPSSAFIGSDGVLIKVMPGHLDKEKLKNIMSEFK